MNITPIPAGRMTPAHVLAWSRLQRADAAVDSPFLRPEFTQAVASVREGVEVAVLEEDGEPVGFFPFQRTRWNLGKPVGGPLNDCQGIVARKGLAWTAEELIRGCGLAAWEFTNLVASQEAFQPYHDDAEHSVFMDLSDGFEAYRAARRESGSQQIKKIMKKGRGLAREAGPLRFEPHTTDNRVFEALIQWKAAQYRTTKVTNVFAFDWTRALLEHILHNPSESLCGMLSALYAGDCLAAVDLGIRSYDVLHAWFPAYNRAFQKYSPGSVLTIEIAKAAESLGIRRIEMGKSSSSLMPYKTRFTTGSTLLAKGSVTRHPVSRMLRRAWHRTYEWVRSSPLRGPAAFAGRWTRPLRGWLAFR